MIKLIASDLDGTLVNDEGKISDKIYDMISKLNKKGVKFAAASGRTYLQLKNNFENVADNMVFVAHNGALIKENRSKKPIYSNSISSENIKLILSLKPGLGEEMLLSADDEAFVVKPSHKLLKEFNEYGVPYVILSSYDEIKKPIYKVSYFVTSETRKKMMDFLKNKLDEDLDFVESGEKWVDIMNKGVSKGSAIKILQQIYGIDKENTMVFGDYYNDLTMFKNAAYSYAMGNAPEDVKKHAKFVADSNNNNGVYNVIRRVEASI